MAYLKAREVRELLKGKVDPKVVFCLEALCEQQSVYRQQLQMMAANVDQIADIVTNFTRVALNMKNTVDAMKGLNPDDDSSPVS